MNAILKTKINDALDNAIFLTFSPILHNFLDKRYASHHFVRK
jgi:hypothetical protein